MLSYSLLYELENELTEKELLKLEKQIEEAHEDYYEALEQLDEEAAPSSIGEAKLRHEAECKYQEELANDLDYIAYQENLPPRINYFKFKTEIETVKTLIFGLNKNPSGKVKPSEWKLFKKTHITPLFPGFTERRAKGYWEGQPENTIELVITCPDNLDNNNKINKIMEAYNKEFNQDCVMKINADNTVEFYEKR